jgi:rubrerythrin
VRPGIEENIMEKSTKMTEGTRINHTGLATAKHAEAMRQVPKMTPAPHDGRQALENEHAHYLKEAHTIGTVPPPSSATGMAQAAVEALKGNKAIALVDKTAERLAFERTGVRLYEGLLEKMAQAEPFAGGPSREAVETIRDQELEHARMLATTLEELGADPTAITPSADLVALEGQGLGQVVGDPRTNVGQCLHALVVAELADNDGWMLLRSLAEEMGQDELANRFARAEEEEEDHLAQVRSWLGAHTRREAELV